MSSTSSRNCTRLESSLAPESDEDGLAEQARHQSKQRVTADTRYVCHLNMVYTRDGGEREAMKGDI